MKVGCNQNDLTRNLNSVGYDSLFANNDRQNVVGYLAICSIRAGQWVRLTTANVDRRIHVQCVLKIWSLYHNLNFSFTIFLIQTFGRIRHRHIFTLDFGNFNLELQNCFVTTTSRTVTHPAIEPCRLQQVFMGSRRILQVLQVKRILGIWQDLKGLYGSGGILNAFRDLVGFQGFSTISKVF